MLYLSSIIRKLVTIFGLNLCYEGYDIEIMRYFRGKCEGIKTL